MHSLQNFTMYFSIFLIFIIVNLLFLFFILVIGFIFEAAYSNQPIFIHLTYPIIITIIYYSLILLFFVILSQNFI
jgi:hypothetical protein